MMQATPALPSGQRPDFTRSRADKIELIVQALSLLAESGQVVELRIPGLKGRRTDSGYFTDWHKLAQAAIMYDERAEGIYITLNPLHPALSARSHNRVLEYAKHTAGDKDVLYRRWLFIDFDPVRPSGISSSDAEHMAALDRAAQCRAWLNEQGIASLLADSGNGAHVLIPVHLPNDEASSILVKHVLSALSAKFSDDQVQVDPSTTGASHLIKLYGTLACKGDNVPERPHRRAAIVAGHESLQPVENSVLEQIAAPARTSEQPTSARSTANGKGPNAAADRTLVETIKARLDMVAFGERMLGVSAVQQGHECRLPGHQGLLINLEKGCWYHHGGQCGGDALDLVGYLLFGSAWNNHDSAMFKAALREAADFAGVPLSEPDRPRNNHAPPAAPDSASSNAPDTTDAKYKPDLMDIATAWKQRFADQLAWDTNVPGWRRWTGTHWQLEREPESLDLLTVEVMRSLGLPISNIGKIDAVLRLARSLCKRQFAAAPGLINFKNGTLDLATLTGHLHNSTDGLTSCLPYDYTPKERFPAIQRFLESAIPDPEGQRALMTHIGLALCGDTTLHKALVLIGPPRSGKTTLLKLAQLVLGFPPGRFATAVLFSAESRGANSRATWIDQAPRLVCLDEFPEEAVRDEGEDLFKSMTAHGGVSMWLKYRDERAENCWTPKLMFATNNRMRYRDSSGALTRRLIVIECPNSLPDAQLDGHLLDKLTPELGAFAAACLTLARQTQQTLTYPESGAMRALLSDIERNGDAVKLWLAEHCVFEPGVFTPTQTLYGHFRNWCEDNGLHAVSRPKLRDVLCSLQPNIKCIKRRGIDPISGTTKPLWGMTGIRLLTANDDNDSG